MACAYRDLVVVNRWNRRDLQNGGEGNRTVGVLDTRDGCSGLVTADPRLCVAQSKG